MICPYICNIQQVNQDTHEHDDDGRETVHNNVLLEIKRPMECAGADCGAWADGRCRYNASPE